MLSGGWGSAGRNPGESRWRRLGRRTGARELPCATARWLLGKGVGLWASARRRRRRRSGQAGDSRKEELVGECGEKRRPGVRAPPPTSSRCPFQVPIEMGEEPSAPTKLAIGVEGGFQTEASKTRIETDSALVVLPSRDSIALPNLDVPKIVLDAIAAVEVRWGEDEEGEGGRGGEGAAFTIDEPGVDGDGGRGWTTICVQTAERGGERACSVSVASSAPDQIAARSQALVRSPRRGGACRDGAPRDRRPAPLALAAPASISVARRGSLGSHAAMRRRTLVVLPIPFAGAREHEHARGGRGLAGAAPRFQVCRKSRAAALRAQDPHEPRRGATGLSLCLAIGRDVGRRLGGSFRPGSPRVPTRPLVSRGDGFGLLTAAPLAPLPPLPRRSGNAPRPAPPKTCGSTSRPDSSALVARCDARPRPPAPSAWLSTSWACCCLLPAPLPFRARRRLHPFRRFPASTSEFR